MNTKNENKMKAGDLVKWSGWKYPILVVDTKEIVNLTCGNLEPYHRCLISNKEGTDFVWLFESQLKLISKSN